MAMTDNISEFDGFAGFLLPVFVTISLSQIISLTYGEEPQLRRNEQLWEWAV